MPIDLPFVAIAPLTSEDKTRYGLFVGLLSDDNNQDFPSAIVIVDGNGLALQAVHISRVHFINREME